MATAKRGVTSTAKTKASKAFATKPAKKLTVEKLERLQGGRLNQSHVRFVVDPETKTAWVPEWVEELRVTSTEKAPKVTKPRKR
jgi:hypothetical protein